MDTQNNSSAPPAFWLGQLAGYCIARGHPGSRLRAAAAVLFHDRAIEGAGATVAQMDFAAAWDAADEGERRAVLAGWRGTRTEEVPQRASTRTDGDAMGEVLFVCVSRGGAVSVEKRFVPFDAGTRAELIIPVGTTRAEAVSAARAVAALVAGRWGEAVGMGHGEGFSVAPGEEGPDVQAELEKISRALAELRTAVRAERPAPSIT